MQKFDIGSLKSSLVCGQTGHQDEPLTHVCCETECRNKGLICYLCQIQKHEKHSIIPFKILLSRIGQVRKESLMVEEQLTQQSARIDLIFQKMNCLLDENRQKFINFANIKKVFQLYTELIRNDILSTLILPIELNEMLDRHSPEKASAGKPQAFISDFNKFVNKHSNKLFLDDYKPEEIISGMKSNKPGNLYLQLLKIQLQEVSKTSDLLLKYTKKSELSDTQVLSLFPVHQNQPYKRMKFCFSPQLMGSCMVLSESNMQATMTSSGMQRVMLLQQSLELNNRVKKWSIRIIKKASWVGVGMCHLNLLKNDNFHFNYSNTGHGSYFISSNGYAWSSYKSEFNSKCQSFTYGSGDLIHLEYDPKAKTIRFQKDGTDESYSLQFDFLAGDPLHPAVNLTGINDCVQIVLR